VAAPWELSPLKNSEFLAKIGPTRELRGGSAP